RGEYRSVRSTKRCPGGGGPDSGDRPVRLRWSLISTGSPTLSPGLMPPAALVSTTARQPAATAVRTPCTTTAGDSPSYRWTRPRNTRTRTVPAVTERTVGACPGTVEAGNPPSSASGRSGAAGPIAPAVGDQPEPSTTAASCEPARAVRRSALAAATAKGSSVTRVIIA